MKPAETCRIRWRRLPAEPDELLLEHVLELRAGERLGDHQVVERLDGERLAVGDLAGRLAARGVGEVSDARMPPGFISAICAPGAAV